MQASATVRTVHDCRAVVTNEGIHRLRRTPHGVWPYCSLNIYAPYDRHIEVAIIDECTAAAQRANLLVLSFGANAMLRHTFQLVNGWIVDNGRQAWPSSNDNALRLCARQAGIRHVVGDSNVLQLVHDVDGDDTVDVKITFVANPERKLTFSPYVTKNNLSLNSPFWAAPAHTVEHSQAAVPFSFIACAYCSDSYVRHTGALFICSFLSLSFTDGCAHILCLDSNQSQPRPDDAR